jgi:hypothetical protein
MFDHLSAVAQLISSLALAYNIWQTWRVKQNVITIERATNSMKDALVAATAKASLLEGTAVGLEQGRNEGKKTS